MPAVAAKALTSDLMDNLLQQDYFTLFDQPGRFQLDSRQLDERYRQLAGEVHPDRYASASDAEKRQALMLATHVNTAYQTLKQPLERARYLLSLSGVDTQEESNTAMPADFLMAQMEWREAIEEARDNSDVETLENLARELAGDIQALQTDLTEMLDQRQDLDGAALAVRKWRFLAKLDEQIGDSIEALLY